MNSTTNQVFLLDAQSGVDTHTVFGSFTNDDFAAGPATLDLTNFGGGWENEWIDNSAPGTTADLLITPFGNFELFGPADAFALP